MNKNEVVVLPSGKYKVGAHGFVYRWSIFIQEWVRSTATVAELEKENEKRQ